MLDIAAPYGSADSVLADCAEVLQPVRRVSITQAAEESLPGYNRALTYYMDEPADCLVDRVHTEVIFVGPARTGKTQSLIDNWVLHGIKIDPADMKIFGPDEKFASWFSKKRLDIELMDQVPELRQRLRPGASNDNVYDKIFRSGAMLSIGWPSKSQLAGRDIVKVAFTDYDRGVQNVGGEGSQFELGAKRTQTFLTRAKTMAESSPGKPVIDPKFIPETAHDAPPTTGILGLYNGGDQRCLYGQCHKCDEYFLPEASINAVVIPEEGSIEYRSQNAKLQCPHCGELIDQNSEREFKKTGRWVKKGEKIDSDGVIHSEGRDSNRASFWMSGWFAAFQSWSSIVRNYLVAKKYYDMTGDETKLQVCQNTDIGGPYLEESRRTEGDPVNMIEDRKEPAIKYEIPEGVRCLLAAVDIQGGKRGRFEVAVLGMGKDREVWPIDRYSITRSNRPDADNPDRFARVNPAVFQEDWDLLTERVLKSTYKLPDGREMRILRTAVDTGGEAKNKKSGDMVTDRVYTWYRKLKKERINSRVMLVKGVSTRANYRVKKTYPDGKSSAKGEIPVWLISTDPMKSVVYSDLIRPDTGPGYYHFPKWWEERYTKELFSETQTDKGWEHESNTPNETFDLFTYIRSMWFAMKGDSVNWLNPPAWVMEWDMNPEVVTREQRQEMKAAYTSPKKPEQAILPSNPRPTRYRMK